MDFGEIFTRAWRIIWRHKILWLFGFLAALGTGGGGGGSGSSSINFSFSGEDFGFRGFENVPQWMQRLMDTMPVWLPLLLALIGLAIFVVVVVLSTFGRIGLSRGAWLADEGEASLPFGTLWRYGTRYFWRVLLLILLLIIITIVGFMIVLIPSIGLTVVTFGIGLICLLPLLCVLGIAASLLTVIFDLAVVGVVNEDLGVMDGLQRAWDVFKSHLGEVIGMALLLWIVSLVIGFVLGLPLLLILAPMIGSLIVQTEFALRGGMLLSLVLFLLYLPVLLVAQGILQSYVGTAWTLVYRRLSGRTAEIA